MLEALKAKFLSRNDFSFVSFMNNKQERRTALDGNDWPTIIRLHKQWYLERTAMASRAPGVVDLDEQDKIKEEWRKFHQIQTTSVDNFAAQFRVMLQMLESRGGLILTEAQKAKAFVEKLNREKFKAWQEQLTQDETRQKEHFATGALARLPGLGLPQTLEEGIERAKVREQQLASTPARNNRKRSNEDLRGSFAAVQRDQKRNKHLKESKNSGGKKQGNTADNSKVKRVYLTRDQMKEMPSSTKASLYGYGRCKNCEPGADDHFWCHCPNKQSYARAEASTTSATTKQSTETAAKPTERLYTEDEVKSILQFAKFQQDTKSGYSRMGFQSQPSFQFMDVSIPSSFLAAKTRPKIIMINDTGGSSFDFPEKFIRGSWEIRDNPISHVPINTVQGTYFCKHVADLPLLGTVHVNKNSDIVVLSFGLLRKNPYFKVTTSGDSLDSCRVTVLPLDIDIDFTWQSNVLMGDATEFLSALNLFREEKVAMLSSMFLCSSERKVYSKVDTEGRVELFESPDPGVAYDATIASHLRRYPSDAGEMSIDDLINVTGFFRRNPEYLPAIRESPLDERSSVLSLATVTYEDDEYKADVTFSRATFSTSEYVVTAADYFPLSYVNCVSSPTTNTRGESECGHSTPLFVSKQAINTAMQAKNLQSRLGKFSLRTVAEAVLGGAVDTGGKLLTRQDIISADAVLGNDPAYLSGVFTKPKHAVNSEEKIDVLSGELLLECDLIFDEELIFFLGVAIPTGWACLKQLSNKSAPSILQAISDVITFFSFFNRTVKYIRCDGESSMSSLTSEVKSKFNVQLEPLPTGVHLTVLDRKARTIKDHVRGTRAASLFVIGGLLLAALYVQITTICNLMPTKFNPESRSPYQELLGRKAVLNDVARDAPLAVVLVPAETGQSNKSANPRMRECVFLHATKPHILGNSTGAYLTTDTWEVIERNHSVSVPVRPELINKINKQSCDPKSKLFSQPFYKEIRKNKRGRPRKSEEQPQEPSTNSPATQEPVEILNGGVETAALPGVELRALDNALRSGPAVFSPRNDLGWEDSGQEVTNIADDIQAGFFKLGTVNPEVTHVEAEGAVIYQFFSRVDSKTKESNPVVYEGRVRYGDIKDLYGVQFNFAAHMSAKKAIDLYPEAGMESLIKEIDGMLERKVWIGKFYSDLSPAQRATILNCSTIVKDKFDLEGNFIKLKSRIVTNGSRQDLSKIPESLRSSPTVNISSVFSVASVAAAKGMKVASIDVQQAYLNADMETEVYMWLDPLLARILVKRDPSFAQYVDAKERILVKLNKAQYGCVESARLWYNNISKFLISIGFQKNLLDPCVFMSKTDNGEDFFITLYVDDLMCFCADEDAIEGFIAKLEAKYTTITVRKGLVHDYLAMRFDFSKPDEVFISMTQYTLDILAENEVPSIADTPAAGNLFEIDTESPLLSTVEREKLHRTVAQCLFMATRTRPDIALPVMFLASRVIAPTTQDQSKLNRVLRYLKGTVDLGIYLGVGPDQNDFRVICFADASHGVHVNGKSHTGIIISHGRGPVLAKSIKQKIVCRSSTESELVALSDATTLAAYELEFFKSLGMDFKPVKMHQDNLSTIRLAKNGRSLSDRTKHIKLRYFFVKQYIDTGEFEVVYCPTDRLVADILTKPLQGETFRRLRDSLLGKRS